MKCFLKVKDVDISTGDSKVVLINHNDAKFLDIHPMDRISIDYKNRSTTAIANIAESEKTIPKGSIGLFEEVLSALKAKNNAHVCVHLTSKPKSIQAIKKKIDGKELSYEETLQLVDDIVKDNLSTIELTSYVTANYTLGMSMKETLDLTKAMIATGNILKHKSKIVADLHSIGGVPGNRTTLIATPIVVAAGILMPKTSSRAITSPAGTADTMEVFCPVNISLSELKKVLKKVGGFILWGGSINLAPADEKIIRIESPLSIDPLGQMLASILAKKKSVGATHLLTEIPYGRDTKIKNPKEAKKLKRDFEYLCGKLGIKVSVWITRSEEPIGNGIGPVLEAIDCLKVMQNHPDAPKDLMEKSIDMAGLVFDLIGKTKKGEGRKIAEEILKSGQAYKAFVRMVKAQGGPTPDIKKLKPAKYTFDFKSNKAGRIKDIDNKAISKIARMAGAPLDKSTGLFIYKHIGDVVKKGDVLFTIYASSEDKLNYAKEVSKEFESYVI
ncbi:AMP phosphorylase [Candidatus Woesearchaeota archaeon]|nr:AMP phosphorylase [Candidatus Woesearchaeota archaeon]